MSEFDKEMAIRNFLNRNSIESDKLKTQKNVFIDEREGLVERVDKTMIVKDGRQLLID
jgi:hypothetical protein